MVALIVAILTFVIGLVTGWLFFPMPPFFSDWYGRENNAPIVLGCTIAAGVIVCLIILFTLVL